MTDTTRRFLVVTSQIVGSLDNWSHDYSSDLELFTDRQAAIDHGLRVLVHDDFNIATVDSDGNLVAYGYDHTDWDDHPDNYDRAEIARQLGLPDSLAQLEACTESPWEGVIGRGASGDRLHRCRAAAGTHRVHECACGIQRYVPEGASV